MREKKEGRKKENEREHIWVFLFGPGGLYSSGLLRPSRAREADLLMAAQLPPQLSVPFSLFLLVWSLLHSFVLFFFFSFDFFFFFRHYLPAHERLAVRTRLRKDLADSRRLEGGGGKWEEKSNPHQSRHTWADKEFRLR